jgi:hypothetical protein
MGLPPLFLEANMLDCGRFVALGLFFSPVRSHRRAILGFR